jgi:hypothetical protein
MAGFSNAWCRSEINGHFSLQKLPLSEQLHSASDGLCIFLIHSFYMVSNARFNFNTPTLAYEKVKLLASR